jgi:hypothetical protein
LIGDLKSKLPFLNKKKSSEDDEDEEEEDDTATETEVSSSDNSDDKKTSVKSKKSHDDDTSIDEELPVDNSLLGKIKSKLNSFKKKKSDDELSEDDVAGDKPAKKKPNLIVIVGAALLIGFIIFSDLGEEEKPAVDPASLLKPRAKKKKPAQTTPTETAPVETAPVETTPTEAAPVETTPVETTPTEAAPVETTPVETTPTEAAPVETTPVETTPTEAAPVETTPIETAPTSPDNSTVDSVTGEDTRPATDDLTDQILKDLENSQVKADEAKPAQTEYVAPPNYENVGRGLVYNCAGKHWACVDAPSYRTCEDNSSSNKYLKKKVECYPFNVYETQSGCEKMQNRVVSSSAKTDFCTEN